MIGLGLGIGALSLAGQPATTWPLRRDLIILLGGQSNEQASNLSDGAPLDPALDQDVTGRIKVWNQASGTHEAAIQPLAPGLWPGGQQHGPLRGFRMAQALLPHLAPGRIIVLVPCAQAGARLAAGPLGSGGAVQAVALARLAACLAALPGAVPILSWTQGEQDSNEGVAAAAYSAAFAEILGQFRAVPGAAGMVALIHQMVPERLIGPEPELPGRAVIDAAQKALSLSLPGCCFVGASPGRQIIGDPSHFTSAGHREAGTRAAALWLRAADWDGVPALPPMPQRLGGRRLRLLQPEPAVPCLLLEHRPAGGSGPWVPHEVFWPHWVDAGDGIEIDLPGSGMTELRLRARTSGGAGPATAPILVDVPDPWWHPAARVHIDYPGDRAFVAGVVYASLAAARTAGAIQSAGGIDRVPVSPGPAWALIATGTTAAIAPAVGVSRYLVGMDDGPDGQPTDMLAALAETRDANGQDYAFSAIFTAGTNQLALSAWDPAVGRPVLRNQTLRIALRAKANAVITSFGGETIGIDTSATVPVLTQIVMGNRDDGARPWSGALGEILFINEEIDEAMLNAALG